MFTIEQVKAVHAKVKTGADFPAYVQDMKTVGVVSYEHFVSDGHTVYYGHNDFCIASLAKYAAMEVAPTGSKIGLQQALTIHQQGETDYPTFCRQAAEAGVEKWTVHTIELTCTYYDKAGNTMLVEDIPEPQAASMN